jgi:outer membrane receptor protein involved in Fe transport
MTKFNPLSAAIGFAIVAGTMSLGATSAYAQDQEGEASEEQVLDTIVVTGSRIQSQTVTSSAPVTEIQREEFAISGATRVDDLINQYPQLSPAFDSQTNNPSTGYATISLRDLGAERTLTLVNGRRLPPGPSGELRDISIIPAALINRVDILTGGASAVYGSDAVAGVVNFMLDTEFEGFSINAGYSAYQHNNDNAYMQELQRRRGFTFEDGNSGFDGAARNVDLAWGGRFGDGSGHAMAWVTYRENDPLFHGQRDYSSCALNVAGTACGGSATNATGNFYFYQAGSAIGGFTAAGRPISGTGASFDSTGRWRTGYGAPYNYAPPNYYQRPDERFTSGVAASYEVNEYFTPYFEAMMVNRKDSSQIAESGAFFTPLTGQSCTNPIFTQACAQLGLNPAQPFDLYVARRNVEGGPRRTDTSDLSYRFVVGSKGAFFGSWNYDASFLFARTQNDTQGFNDFLTSRIQDALLNCPTGSFEGCQFYNVWRPGGVTAAAANALAGVSFNKTDTEMRVFNAYATGDAGFAFPTASDNIWAVIGVESRFESFAFVADSNSAAGNFAGAGAAAPPIDGSTKVSELFAEAAIPLFSGDGLVKSLDADVGYRYSDYDRSGGANTYKFGLTGEVGLVRPRFSYNRAIRAPGINDLFAQRQTALFGSADICSGTAAAIAERGFTQAQCARTGVSAAQFGLVPSNPANQNNQFIGGTSTLVPEEADTYTLGFVIQPIENLAIAVDYYDIRIEDTITGIGAATILEGCALTGERRLCDLIVRNPVSGDIWRNPNNYVINITDNFGEREVKGIDLNVSYAFEALGGRFATNLVGNYIIEDINVPLPGISDVFTFDCAGRINPSCQTSEWRHIASLRYSRDSWSANLRWRYFGALDYIGTRGQRLTADTLVAANGGIDAYNYIDLSGSYMIADNVELTVGVNNVADKEPPLVGSGNALNANAPGGYDQTGRYIFSSINVKF